MTKYEELAKIIKEAKVITILSGAGLSTESGIPDFRSSQGVYTQFDNVEYLISETYFRNQPEKFWQSFKEIFKVKLADNYQPNIGHTFLVELENMGKQVHVLTQNVDGLHKKAGSKHVYELHGTIHTATCPKCRKKYDLTAINQEEIPRCSEDQQILKPDVVLFGGAVQYIEEAFDLAAEADVFMVLGSSLTVYPVSAIPESLQHVKRVAKVIINKDKTYADSFCDFVFHEPIGEVVRQMKKYL